MGVLLVSYLVSICLVFLSCERVVVGSYNVDEFLGTNKADVVSADPLLVDLTLIPRSGKAVCLDGSAPGYYLDHGSGSGANSWLIQLEGGGWCNTIKSCILRKKTRHGSSKYFDKATPFAGILSNKESENPAFHNWTRVKVPYCDGGSFAGDSENKTAGLQFRGKRIFRVVMEELMSKGMNNSIQALLSGCSAGGLASILHCDKFRRIIPATTEVKCLSDAGLFMDAADISGRRTMRELFIKVVRLHNITKRLTRNCPKHFDRASCLFPQNLINHIKTPLFILNAAYDSWQIRESLVPDPKGTWKSCISNYTTCSEKQMDFFHDFRKQMLNATKVFAGSRKNGLYINSCFSHGLSERQDTWFGPRSPTIMGLSIADAVSDWCNHGVHIKEIESEPVGPTCHNLVFRG